MNKKQRNFHFEKTMKQTLWKNLLSSVGPRRRINLLNLKSLLISITFAKVIIYYRLKDFLSGELKGFESPACWGDFPRGGIGPWTNRQLLRWIGSQNILPPVTRQRRKEWKNSRPEGLEETPKDWQGRMRSGEWKNSANIRIDWQNSVQRLGKEKDKTTRFPHHWWRARNVLHREWFPRKRK